MKTDEFSQLFEIDKDSFTKNWIKSGKLILGKYKILDIDNNVKIVELKNGDKIPENVDIEMNPIL
jgi:hypothetical protein